MNLRRLAGLAIGLALPLTFVAGASADYSEAQTAFLESVGWSNPATSASIPVAGGVALYDDDGARVAVVDIHGTIYDHLIGADD